MTHGRSAAEDVRMLSRYVYERTRGRLGGLTDREYLWEPAPDCATVRLAGLTGI